ncbi:ell-associated factor Eaf [Aethina tumida]|uniref:ell-associated factor Eaf n=1 Tax=Aethina tumida TaxID=116153 RepID=UPI002148F215|nr:ell-associated factor Eaf [Aethina tumida]
MADKLGLGNEVRELRIGQSFTNPKSTAFHSVRYDFKPASVDTNKKATVEIGNNHQVTVTVPHLDGAGTPQTVFKGSQRPYQKECVLIIDKVTGQVTIEKLASNIQVKKTRSEFGKPSNIDRLSGQSNERNSSGGNLAARSQTPPIVGHRVSHKTKVTSGSRRPDRPITHLVPKHSPLHASPSYSSPGHHARSPKREAPPVTNNESSQSALASLPLISLDDYSDPPPPVQHNVNQNQHQNQTNEKSPLFPNSDNENGIGEITDSSSSSSDSDSDSDNDESSKSPSKTNGHSNGLQTAAAKINNVLLKEDLCLSETGSESD